MLGGGCYKDGSSLVCQTTKQNNLLSTKDFILGDFIPGHRIVTWVTWIPSCSEAM